MSRLKILYIVNGVCTKGGVERILSDSVNYLVDNCGYDISILTLDGNVQSVYPYSPKVRFISYSHAWNVSFLGKLKDMFKFHRYLSDIINETEPDVVVKVQTSGYSWIIPWVKSVVPKVLWVHTSKIGVRKSMKAYQNHFFNWVYFRLCSYFMSRYNKVVMLTEDDRRDWNVKNGVVIPNFTNFNILSTVKSSGGKKRAICVARYDYFKRLDLLVEAWSGIHNQFPDWILEIYGGEGDCKPAISEQVVRHNATDYIKLYEACDNIGTKYSESSVFCFTSEYEGFGLVLLEAMSHKLPVIAFSASGVNSIVKDDYNGYLVPFGDVDSYQQKLSSLLSSPELRNALGQNGLSTACLYSKTSIMREWQTLFTALANNKI